MVRLSRKKLDSFSLEKNVRQIIEKKSENFKTILFMKSSKRQTMFFHCLEQDYFKSRISVFAQEDVCGDIDIGGEDFFAWTVDKPSNHVKL